MKRLQQIGLGAIVTTVAAIVGMWVALNPWPIVGWTTPNQHDADYKVTSEQLKDFRDEWKCDEYDEELLELRKKLSEARTTEEHTELTHEIEKLQRKMDSLNCERFEDYG